MTPPPEGSKRKRGNPNFVKGHKLKSPGRPKGSVTLTNIPRCKEFMEKEGWDILEGIARDEAEASKNRIGACSLLAAYGYGKPREQVDVKSDGAPVKFTLGLGQADTTQGQEGTAE